MRAELVVVGAGPAGLAAAAAATGHGIRTLILDRRSQGGGQYYARPPARRWLDGLPGHILAGLEPQLLEVRLNAEVWGAFPERTLALSVEGNGSELVEAGSIVLATGASERPLPFPGWDGVGVMATGAAQLLLKESSVIPVGRVVIAGTGPFLLAVAAQLQIAGARVETLVEAQPLRRVARLLPGLLADPAMRTETIRYLRSLRGLNRRFGATITEAAPGELSLSTGERIPFDALCVGHGFTPRLELAMQLGCRIGPDGLIVSEDLATSEPGVRAAGEATGVGGARLALAEGRLAGLAAARELRPGSVADHELSTARSDSAKLRAFARRLFAAYEPLHALALATPETTICRCEGVSLGMIRAARASTPAGNHVRAMKALVRCGMGPCQGTMCMEAARAALGDEDRPGWSTPAARPPLGSVSVSAVAGLRFPS